MPNHITNWLALRGPAEKLDAIEQAIKEERLLDYCLPMPSSYRGGSPLARLACTYGGPRAREQEAARAALQAAHGYGTPLDWCTHHWGTKWDIYYVSAPVRLSPTQLLAQFDTAWGQPSGALKKLLKDNATDVTLLCLSEDEGGWPCTLMYSCNFESGAPGNHVRDRINTPPRVTEQYAMQVAERTGWTEEVTAMKAHYGFSAEEEEEAKQ